MPVASYNDLFVFGLIFHGEGTLKYADVEFVALGQEESTNNAYVFFSGEEDTFYMKHWGANWDSGSTFELVENDEYAKTLVLTSGTGWGENVHAAAVAWGNNREDAIDVRSYTHARFKVTSSDFANVRVSQQSARWPSSEVTYPLADGTALGNGWVE